MSRLALLALLAAVVLCLVGVQWPMPALVAVAVVAVLVSAAVSAHDAAELRRAEVRRWRRDRVA